MQEDKKQTEKRHMGEPQENNSFPSMLGDVVAGIFSIIGSILSLIFSVFDRWNEEEKQNQQQQAALNAQQAKFNDSVYVQHDLAAAIRGMNLAQGVAPISTPANLAFIYSPAQPQNLFTFQVNKTVVGVSLGVSVCQNITHRINTAIKQFPAKLYMQGLTQNAIAYQFPALYHGFSVQRISEDKFAIYIDVVV